MAFVLTATRNDFRPKHFQQGAESLVVVNIGHDDRQNWSYSVVAGLSPMAGGDSEFFFHVVKADGDADDEQFYWSGRETAFLVGRDRAEVLMILLGALRDLLLRHRPARVFMVTHDDDAPSRALIKYDRVASAFRLAGYVVREDLRAHGRCAWWMELK